MLEQGEGLLHDELLQLLVARELGELVLGHLAGQGLGGHDGGAAAVVVVGHLARQVLHGGRRVFDQGVGCQQQGQHPEQHGVEEEVASLQSLRRVLDHRHLQHAHSERGSSHDPFCGRDCYCPNHPTTLILASIHLLCSCFPSLRHCHRHCLDMETSAETFSPCGES